SFTSIRSASMSRAAPTSSATSSATAAPSSSSRSTTPRNAIPASSSNASTATLPASASMKCLPAKSIPTRTAWSPPSASWLKKPASAPKTGRRSPAITPAPASSPSGCRSSSPKDSLPATPAPTRTSASTSSSSPSPNSYASSTPARSTTPKPSSPPRSTPVSETAKHASTSKENAMAPANDHLTRRTFLAGAGAVAATTLVNPAWPATTTPGPALGEWLDDAHGLPCYRYFGPLRFPDSPQRDGAPMIPDDPFFLLGNYRLTLFTHAIGLYQILTGERAWG